MKKLKMLLVAVALISLFGCEKYELDRQMEALCKIDGGVKVWETVILPSDAFDNTGMVITEPAKKLEGGGYRQVVHNIYSIDTHTDVIKAGDPFKSMLSEGRLLRFRTVVKRINVDKALGEQIAYGRTGGGFTINHPSQNYCPKPQPTGVIKRVFSGAK